MEHLISCVAVDDEQLALKLLANYISQTPGIVLDASFRNPLEAKAWINTHQTGLLFLDINMPQQSGIVFLDNLKQRPVTIFTTAYSGFAADAYDLAAVDYLRKPFSLERFQAAVEKARLLILSGSNEAYGVSQAFLPVKTHMGTRRVYLKDILYIEAFQEYIKIFTQQERFIMYERMKNMEAELPAHLFLRVHRSYIVGMAHVSRMENNQLLVANTTIPVSRDLKEKVMRQLFRK
jgi:DNA-binding LytR/AlgR family response regulator